MPTESLPCSALEQIGDGVEPQRSKYGAEGVTDEF